MRVFCCDCSNEHWECYNGNMTSSQKLLYIIAIIVALAISGGAFVYKFFIAVPPPVPREIPSLGIPGSAHKHASLLLMIGNRVVDFCDAKYMLKSPLAHFEDGNCYVVHVHATGVTLVTFLKTIGVEVTSQCVVIPGEAKHCNDAQHTLRTVVNGSEIPIPELSYYEIRNNDHILINYGPETGYMLKFKYNQVPPVPLDVNEPLVNM